MNDNEFQFKAWIASGPKIYSVIYGMYEDSSNNEGIMLSNR